MLQMSRQPLSLDQPVGDHDDSYFGEFLEDYREDDPLYDMNHDLLKDRIADVLAGAELPRARDHPPALRAGRRLRLHAGRGRQDLLRHPGTRPPDRGQGRPQAPAPGPVEEAGRLPRTAHRRAAEARRRRFARRQPGIDGKRVGFVEQCPSGAMSTLAWACCPDSSERPRLSAG